MLVIFAENLWKYIVPTSSINENWNNINFDDSDWLEGIGGFGYGDNDDGTILAEARLEVEALEILTGRLLEDDDRDEIDTVGGLVCAVAGRVPGRGEVVRHPTGVQFEVIEGDPRRLSLLKVRGAPRQAQPSGG